MNTLSTSNEQKRAEDEDKGKEMLNQNITLVPSLQSLSNRGLRAVKPMLPYLSRFLQGAANIYSSSNKHGNILFCVAENRTPVYATLMIPALTQAREISITAATGSYGDFSGRMAMRKAFSNMVSYTFLSKSKIIPQPEHLVISAGCGSIISNLAVTLCEPNDAILLPTPTYAALPNDVSVLAQAVIIGMPAKPENNYGLTLDMLQKGLQESLTKGHRPRVVFLINPQNPIGTIYTRKELEMAIDFCEKENLHLIVDEIYANSVYDETDEEKNKFMSIVEIMALRTNTKNDQNNYLGNYVHVIWGLSKDFCMSGYRIGILFTHNIALLKAMSTINYFSCVSFDTQDVLATVLSNESFVKNYLQTARKSLLNASNAVIHAATRLGVPFQQPSAGMFVWLDFQSFLPLHLHGWEAEHELTRLMFEEAKVLLTPGEACFAERPGFYRLCFAWMEDPIDAIEECFRRLEILKQKIHLIKDEYEHIN